MKHRKIVVAILFSLAAAPLFADMATTYYAFTHDEWLKEMLLEFLSGPAPELLVLELIFACVWLICAILAFRKRRFRILIILLLLSAICLSLYLSCVCGKHQMRVATSEMIGGGGSVPLNARWHESFKQYLKRAHAKNHNICEICGAIQDCEHFDNSCLVYYRTQNPNDPHSIYKILIPRRSARSEVIDAFYDFAIKALTPFFVKRVRSWAEEEGMSCMTKSERDILWHWQLFVCEKEGRFFRNRRVSQNRMVESIVRICAGTTNKNARSIEYIFQDQEDVRYYLDGSEDFIKGEISTSAFILSWYDRALNLGYEPSERDKALVEKMKGRSQKFEYIEVSNEP